MTNVSSSDTPGLVLRRFLPFVVLIGLLLGVANYSLGIWPTLGQSLVQQVLISLVCGGGLIYLIAALRAYFPELEGWQRWAVLLTGAVVLGFIGTEVERLTSSLLFDSGSYLPLRLSGGHGFNIVLTVALAIGFWQVIPGVEMETEVVTPTLVAGLPVRGEDKSVNLLPVDEVIFLEAANNHCYAVDDGGRRHFCDLSLAYLAPRLGDNFIRVHRKYLINRDHLRRISPGSKGRYELTFSDPESTSIVSGASYRGMIQPLFRPE